MNVMKALLDHAWRLMTLRHDGEGLPKERGGMLYVLCALLVLSGLTQFFASSLRPSVVEYVVVYAMMILFVVDRPVLFGAALLPIIFCNLLYIPLYLVMGRVPVAVDLLIMGWALAAVGSVWLKMMKKGRD